ncbi:MAG TPA: DUF1003 domain-containing protein [Mycobacteriales bacterium]|nr:DUF1003 domain-containing protein [Mycobacteriales bacterium]
MADRGGRRRVRRLDQPKGAGPRWSFRLTDDAVGRWSERVARFFGTARFLVMQTVIVCVWIALNVAEVTRTIRWDPYPFILLNLAFSTQAAYAAPLILLAQNRQAYRDRVSLEEDRAQNVRQATDMEYLAREIASIRIALGEVATRDFLRSELSRLAGARAEDTPDEREQR